MIAGAIVAVVAGSAFVVLQVRMWRTVIARWRLMRMMNDLKRSKPGSDRERPA